MNPNAPASSKPSNPNPQMVPNAPRGPAAMRNQPNSGAPGSSISRTAQPDRYSTQGQARSRPY